MSPQEQLQAKLEAAANGKLTRPRGHSVTADEYAAVAPFAKACMELAEQSLHRDYAPFVDEQEPADGARITAPSTALPPLP